MKKQFSITAIALGVLLVVATSCGTQRTASGYPYPGSPYPGSPNPGGYPYPGTTYPYPGGSYPYPSTYPPARYPRQSPPVVIYKEPQKVYVPERRREVIVEHRNDRRYNSNDHRRNDRDRDDDHDRDDH